MKKIALLIALAIAFNANADPPANVQIQEIDSKIAIEKAKGAQADQNLIQWYEAKKTALLPPGKKFDDAEIERQTQKTYARIAADLAYRQSLTDQVKRYNDANAAARNAEFNARMGREAAIRQEYNQAKYDAAKHRALAGQTISPYVRAWELLDAQESEQRAYDIEH